MMRFTFLAVSVLLAACAGGSTPGTPSAPAPSDPSPSAPAPSDPLPSVAALAGAWQLQRGTVNGQEIPIVAAHPVTLTIDGTTIGGVAACNEYGGTIQISGGTIRFFDVVQTEMACADENAMTAEQRYTSALQVIDTAARDGDALVLSGPGADLRFVAVAPGVVPSGS